jgi:hypothetical protein
MGSLAAWLMYRLSRQLVSGAVGVASTALLVTSPVFVATLLTPMSDIPATALVLSALVFACCGVRVRAFAAGLVVALLILVRPNLVLVALALAAGICVRERQWEGRRRALLAYGIPVAIACLAIAALHTYLYGAPWKSGYGGLSGLYAWTYASENIARFTGWLLETQSPFLFAALIPVIAWTRVPRDLRDRLAAPVAVAFAVLLSYVFYLPFDSWDYLRFLLPAMPGATLLALVGCGMATRRIPAVIRAVILSMLVIVVTEYQVDRVRRDFVLDRRHDEAASASVGEFAARNLPANALFVSYFHSGSLRLYAGRPTLRFDFLDPSWWPRAAGVLTALGFRPYVVLSESEAPLFRERFHLSSPPGALVAELPHRVRVYDPLGNPGGNPRSIPLLVPCPCTSRTGLRAQ